MQNTVMGFRRISVAIDMHLAPTLADAAGRSMTSSLCHFGFWIQQLFMLAMFFSENWNPEGLHAYITGGSNGLGLSLAILLVKKGAHVSIVARNQQRLDEALNKLESVRKSPKQVLQAFSFSLNNATSSAEALTAACKAHGSSAPDAVFACAGSSKPMFFVDMAEQEFGDGMVNGYWVQAWTAFAAAKMYAKQEKKGGKIVFVSSTLGYMSFIGYSSYSPAKHALRGLADTLASELLLYSTDVHIFFPPTMYTPGYEEENKTKPRITLEIESTDEGLTPDQAALALLTGVENGERHITADFITKLFSVSTRGATPRNNWVWEGLLDFIAYIAIPVWRRSVDQKVVSHRAEHREYLRSSGFLN